MGRQTTTGKAFEFALAQALCREAGGSCALIEDAAYATTKRAFGNMAPGERRGYILAARAAAGHVALLEPNLTGRRDLAVRVQPDAAGRDGDVRDIVVAGGDGWEIGFSAKNNHAALKHSRLSDSIDFGAKWVGVCCSEQYMSQARRTFGHIRGLMREGHTMWRQVDHKHAIYGQILDAFRAELYRLARRDPDVPSRLVRYLLGRRDFYKVIKLDRDRLVRIQGFNIDGNLGRRHGGTRPQARVSQVHMPARLGEVTSHGINRLAVSLDGGWGVSFRIHNATSRLEPSLKFDIQLIGVPQNIYVSNPHWDETGAPADPQRPSDSDAGDMIDLPVRVAGGAHSGKLA